MRTRAGAIGDAAAWATTASICLGVVTIFGPTLAGVVVAAAFAAVAVVFRRDPDLLPPKGGVIRWLQVVALVGLALGLLATRDPALLRVLMLVGLSLALTVPSGPGGARAGVLVAAFAVVAGAVVGVVEADWLFVPWMLVTLVALALSHAAEVGGAERLDGSTGGRRLDRALVTAAVAALLVLVAAPALAALVPPPSPAGGGRPGDWPQPSQVDSPYVSRHDELDLADRPNWGDLDRTVLTVTADEPSFWRGETFDRWDGERWTSEAGDAGQVLYGSTVLETWGRELRAAGVRGEEDLETLTQRFRVEGPYLDVVVAAPSPASVAVPAGRISERADGSIDIPGGLGQGATYTVESVRVTATAERLRADDPRDADLSGFEPFLALPDDVPDRVRDLAADLGASAPSTYDLVQEIHAWLGDRTEYTRELPPLPAGADPVEQHLFVDRRGWCEQIATSTAVLLRLNGVPARLATGFVPGERSLVGNEFRVRAGDAHAWVEVWFPGSGWQGFDPTASVPLAGDADRTVVQRLLDNLSRIGPILAVLAGVVAVALGAFLLWRWRAGRHRPNWSEQVVATLDRAGRRRQRPRRPSETVLDYAEALRRGPLPDERLGGVAGVVTAAMYGGVDPDGPTRSWVDDVLAESQRANPLPRWWRRRR